MNIRPLHDRIVVKRVDEQETLASGIIIPDSAKEKPQKGEVVAVGKGKRLEDGKVVSLDVQVGDSTLQKELPLLSKYLSLPQVHLAIDPEFSMKHNEKPGTVVGTMDATDINYAAQYLANLVRQNNLPPKVLLVHRFTFAMVTNYKKIITVPEVQIVMDMDGFGTRARKLGTYTQVVEPQPVQFTGFKLFYKNDVPPRGDAMMTPAQITALTPAPLFIQYQ